jgi:glucan phosphoethanolaminetransferase (alkaline phosphatase superfamily)
MLSVTTIIILGVLIFVAFFFLKMEHQTRRVKIILIILAIMLIYFSLVGILNSEKVDLKSPRGVVSAVYLYFGWIGQTASNLWDVGKDTFGMVGNAIKLGNYTDKDKNDGRR